MEPVPINIGNQNDVVLCANCLAYQVEEKGQKCKRCAPVEQTASVRTDAELGAFVTLFALAAIGVGALAVFLVKWLGS